MRKFYTVYVFKQYFKSYHTQQTLFVTPVMACPAWLPTSDAFPQIPTVTVLAVMIAPVCSAPNSFPCTAWLEPTVNCPVSETFCKN